jgi:carboxymethylenebutenolidase
LFLAVTISATAARTNKRFGVCSQNKFPHPQRSARMSTSKPIFEHISPPAPAKPVHRRDFIKGSLAAGFAAAVLPVTAQTIYTDSIDLTVGEVKVPTKDGSIPAYFAMPATGKSFGVVLVVHEIFGVHEHIKDICRRLAKAGYYAIAPDLFIRQGDVSVITSIQDIQKNVTSKVPDAQVMSDLDACIAYAATNKALNVKKLAITGFCWGGRITWLYAAHNQKLKTGVAWYGRLEGATSDLTPKHPIDVVSQINSAILGLYGAADTGISIESVERMQQALKSARKKSKIIIYPETPHAFNADYRPSYREAAAKDAWGKLIDWFEKNGM